MNKKILVIAIAVVLCLAVVGGCFALYENTPNTLTFTFGSEQAVALSLSTASNSLNFNNVKLNPTTKSATQNITLDVTTTNKSALAGKSGKLTVVKSGALVSSITLSAVADSKNYTEEQLTTGVVLDLDALPQDFALTVSLPSDITDNDFIDISNKTCSITVKWEVVEWAPVNDAFYIVGSFSNWEINENAILLTTNPGNAAEVMATNVALAEGATFKIVKCDTSKADNRIFYGVGLKEDSTENITGGGAYEGGPDFVVGTTGSYDFYFDGTNKLYASVHTTGA